MRIHIVALLVLVTTAAACQKPAATPAPGAASTTAAPAQTPATAGPATPAPGTAAAPAEPPVKPVPPQLPGTVAKVNGDAITGAELEDAVRALEANVGQSVPIEQRDRVYRQVMDELIGFRLLAQAAASAKLTITDAEVDAQIAQIRKQYPNEQAFLGALQQQGLSVDRLRTRMRSQMQVAKIIEKQIAPSIGVDDKAIGAFYEGNKQQFFEPEAVRTSHILFRVPENADAATRSKARVEADAVLKRARKGEDFAKLAREFSQDNSAANGGDLGLVPRGQTPPPFETAIFALKQGQVGSLVETTFGFHIVKVAERRQARQVPLPEVTDRIRQFLVGQQQQQKTAELVGQLRAKAKVDVLI